MNPMRVVLLSATVGVLSMLFAACGSDSTATPTSAPTATPPPNATPTATPDAAAVFQAEWEALITAAQEEGQIVGVRDSRGLPELAEVFSEKFGIRVIHGAGSSREQASRIIAEQQAGRYLVDVTGMGPGSLQTLIDAGAADDTREWLFHPEVLDLSLWVGGFRWFADVEGKHRLIFSYRAFPENLSAFYNINNVSQEDIDGIESAWDLLNPKWKGRIVAEDPSGPGATIGYFRAYANADIGQDWLRRFITEMDVFFTRDARIRADGLIKGKFDWQIIGGAGYGDLIALGLPVAELLKPLTSVELLEANRSGGAIAVIKNPPNPNATKLWVNWLLGKEGQTLWNEVAVDAQGLTPHPSLRRDVPTGNAPPEILVDLGKLDRGEYLLIDVDRELLKLRPAAKEFAARVYNESR